MRYHIDSFSYLDFMISKDGEIDEDVEMLANQEADMYKMDVADMRMLMWMCGKTRKDKIRNERLQEHLWVASMGDKIRETHLKWFGHVQHRLATVPVRKSMAMRVNGPPRGRGRPKRTWMEVIKIDLKKCNLF